jgi:hypothetical protein
MRKKAFKIALWFSVIFIVVIQAFQIDKTNPISDPELDFLTSAGELGRVGNILKKTCYDCHSNQSVYPWYSSVNPAGWLIRDHIDEAREHLNFSEWTKYEAKKQDHKLEECLEEFGEGEMPIQGYALMHPEADLSDEDKQLLMDYFKTRRAAIKL